MANELFQAGFSRFHSPPVVRIDIQQRCAVMQFCDKKLAVIPFASVTTSSDSRSASMAAASTAFAAALSTSLQSSTNAFYSVPASASLNEVQFGSYKLRIILLRDCRLISALVGCRVTAFC
jgi:hypothetical protein